MSIIKFAVFIPVRGGSKSIPLKNIKKLNGKPLVHWVLDAAVNCNLVQKIFVCTDSSAIRQSVNSFQKLPPNFKQANKIVCIGRDPETATDTASTESAMLEFAREYNFENIVLIQATSPLLTSQDLDKALNKFCEFQYDSLLSVVRQKRFIWQEKNGGEVESINYKPDNRPRRQEFDGFLVENGAFYITKRERLLESGCRLSGKIGYYEMNEASYYELDEADDWLIVESLMQKRNQNFASDFQEKLKNIKLLAMDCDGVLTDGGMYYSELGDELKKFNTRDGMGINILHEHGIKTAIITSENVEIVKKRAQKLKINDVYLGEKNKISAIEELICKYGLKWEEIAYIGDDLNDLELLKLVGVSFAPANAIFEIREVVDYISQVGGGEGVVREIVDLIVRNKR